MVAEKIETLVVLLTCKRKMKPPGAQVGPSGLRPALREYKPKLKKINEIQVTKIKKYVWFTTKSNICDF